MKKTILAVLALCMSLTVAAQQEVLQTAQKANNYFMTTFLLLSRGCVKATCGPVPSITKD